MLVLRNRHSQRVHRVDEVVRLHHIVVAAHHRTATDHRAIAEVALHLTIADRVEAHLIVEVARTAAEVRMVAAAHIVAETRAVDRCLTI